MGRPPTSAKRFDDVAKKLQDLTMKIHVAAVHWGIDDTARLYYSVSTLASVYIQRLIASSKALADTTRAVDRTKYRLCPHLIADAAQRQTERQRQKRYEQKCLRDGRSKVVATKPPAPTFPQFMSLPPELRLMIWEAAAQPPSCLDIYAIWEDEARNPPLFQARKFSWEPRKAEMVYIPGNLIHEHEWRLWNACREAREVVRRVHEENAKFAEKATNRDVFCPLADKDHVNLHVRNIGKLFKAGCEFQNDLSALDDHVEAEIIEAEHAVRTKMQKDAGDQTPPENFLAAVLRELYEIEGDLPKRAEDGPIPVKALKHVAYFLWLERLLGRGKDYKPIGTRERYWESRKDTNDLPDYIYDYDWSDDDL